MVSTRLKDTGPLLRGCLRGVYLPHVEVQQPLQGVIPDVAKGVLQGVQIELVCEASRAGRGGTYSYLDGVVNGKQTLKHGRGLLREGRGEGLRLLSKARKLLLLVPPPSSAADA